MQGCIGMCGRRNGVLFLGLVLAGTREGCSPVVRHRIVRAGQGDDDLVVQHFDMES